MDIEISKEQYARVQIESAEKTLKNIEFPRSSADKEDRDETLAQICGQINIALFCLVEALDKLGKKPLETKIKFK